MRAAAQGLCLLVLVCCRDPRASETAFRARLIATPVPVKIGEPVELRLETTQPTDAEPDLSALPPDLEVRSSLVRTWGGGAWRWTVTSFTAGAIEVPSLPVHRVDHATGGRLTAATDPLVLQFTAPSVAADDALRPVSGRLDVGTKVDWWPVAGASLVVVIIGTTTRAAANTWLTGRRLRRDWHARINRVRAYEAAVRGSSEAEGRMTCHHAAADIRRALGVAKDGCMPFATVVSALDALDAVRFARTFVPTTGADAIAKAHAGLLRMGRERQIVREPPR